MNQIIEEIEKSQLQERAPFKVGDEVAVHTLVREGNKERIQIFKGICISRKGGGVNETFTVRRRASGVGVEKVFPVHSPLIAKVEIVRESMPRRARMYYIRDRVGKAAETVREKRLVEGAK
jgi:large subunit ribosomal protein L19